jgi:hypothetical protein
MRRKSIQSEFVRACPPAGSAGLMDCVGTRLRNDECGCGGAVV